MEPYTVSISYPVKDDRESDIVSSVLDIDNMDFGRSDLKKEIFVRDKAVFITFSTKDMKLLRNSVNTVLDHIPLIKDTIEQFGPPLN